MSHARQGHHRSRTLCQRLAAPAAGLGLSLALASCSVRVRPEQAGGADGKPCNGPEECPQPPNPCELAYCVDQQCQVMAAPEGQLPDESQKKGDCKQVYCDGNGQQESYPAPHDTPPDDGNACTAELCQGLEPKQVPTVAGSPCDGGMCNGAGTCGVCLPNAQKCAGNAIRRCSAEGQWADPEACAPLEPICVSARCLAIADYALGSEHGCARLANGTVRCWGSNSSGELGTGRPTPAPFGSAQAPRAIALGRRHGCAIESSGAVACWGANDFGQLGSGTYESSSSPVPTPLAGATEVAVGADFSCALGSDGAIQCWGRNERGQLGRGAARELPCLRRSPAPRRPWASPSPRRWQGNLRPWVCC